MEAAVLSLLLVTSLLDRGRARVSVTVTPRRSQFFKYDSFSVSCEEEEGWTVMKKMEDGEVHPCRPSCSVPAAFPATDSGSYWCETGAGVTSDAVNITVTAGSVILESPVLTVTEGDDVTLRCRCKVSTSVCDAAADFYKDGVLFRKSSTGNTTIRGVFRSDEGLYKCQISGSEESPESWLTVRAPPSGRDPPALLQYVPTLVRYLLVGTPYLLSTILLALVYRDRKKERRTSEARQTCDAVMMQIVT